jgi:hypothetical protein
MKVIIIYFFSIYPNKNINKLHLREMIMKNIN